MNYRKEWGGTLPGAPQTKARAWAQGLTKV